MNAKILPVVLAGLLLVPPAALAQTPQGQIEEAADRAETIAESATEDPERFATNATNESWRQQQANWTLAWSCATVYAVDEDAGELASDATGCPTPEDARSTPDDEQNDQNRSTAEPADEVETAIRDLIASIFAFGDGVREDPEQTPDHATTLVNRTLTIVERVVDALISEIPTDRPALLQDQPSSILRSTSETFQEASDRTSDRVSQAISHAQAAAKAAHETIRATASASVQQTAQAGQAIQDATTSSIQAATDALRSLAPDGLLEAEETGTTGPSPSPAPGGGALVEAPEALVDHVQEP